MCRTDNLYSVQENTMKTKILTSGFPNGFTSDFNDILVKFVDRKGRFTLIASDFENNHEKTDRYCKQWLRFFNDCGIDFKHSCVVDCRMTPEIAKKAVTSADVLWLSGGNTLAQMKSIESYGLLPALRERDGVTIGMSAGSINMAKTAIYIPYREQPKLEIYQAIGLVDISIEPHYGSRSLLNEMLHITNEYPLYGLSDESFIVINDDDVSYSGDIFFIEKGVAKQISYAKN